MTVFKNAAHALADKPEREFQSHKVAAYIWLHAWNRPRCGGLELCSLVPGVPMAVITYGTDVAPHLWRGLMYRRLRVQRWQALHRHDHEVGDAYNPYDDDAYDPYSWAKTGHRFNLIITVIALLFFAAGTWLVSLFKLHRFDRA